MPNVTVSVIYAAMDLKDFFSRLDDSEQERFAKTAGTTVGYLRAHVLPRRKIPRSALMNGLVVACQTKDPQVTRAQVVEFFYSELAA